MATVLDSPFSKSLIYNTYLHKKNRYLNCIYIYCREIYVKNLEICTHKKMIFHCIKNAHGVFALSGFFFLVFLFHSNEHVCVPTQLAICHKPERSTRCFFLHHTQPKNKDAELVCVHLSTSPGCVQRGRATWTTRSSCSVPALHLPVLACWETLR